MAAATSAARRHTGRNTAQFAVLNPMTKNPWMGTAISAAKNPMAMSAEISAETITTMMDTATNAD